MKLSRVCVKYECIHTRIYSAHVTNGLNQYKTTMMNEFMNEKQEQLRLLQKKKTTTKTFNNICVKVFHIVVVIVFIFIT